MKKAFFAITFLAFLIFSPTFVPLFGEDTIFLPDLTSSVTGWNFQINEDAFPMFSPEPLNFELENASQFKAESQETSISTNSLKQNDEPVAKANETDNLDTTQTEIIAETESSKANSFIAFAGENTLIKNAALGVNAFAEVDYVFSNHFAVQSKLGLLLVDENQFTFDAFIDATLFVKNYLPVDFGLSVGTESFKNFVENSFISVAGIYGFGSYKNTLSLNFAKTFSITEKITFSTDYNKYAIDIGLKIPFARISPTFFVSAKIAFFY